MCMSDLFVHSGGESLKDDGYQTVSVCVSGLSEGFKAANVRLHSVIESSLPLGETPERERELSYLSTP